MIVISAIIPLCLERNVVYYMALTKSFTNFIDDSQEKILINVQHFAFKLNDSKDWPQIVLKLIKKYSKDANQKIKRLFFYQI